MVTICVKTGLFQFHLNSATRFAFACAEIENKEKHLEWPQPRWDEARSNALAAVLLAATSLECSVNEFYQQAVDRDRDALKPLSEAQMFVLNRIWQNSNRLQLCPRPAGEAQRYLCATETKQQWIMEN
jgi:hypothetical protein